MATAYKFTLQDCLVLGQTLPGRGKINQMRIINRLAEALELTDEEEAAIGYQELGTCPRCGYSVRSGNFRWDPEKAETRFKIVEVSEAAAEEILKALRKAEDDGQIAVSHVELWDEFVLNKNVERFRPEQATQAPPPEEG